MTLPGENKSKFSFTSLISKAYHNTFGAAVSYAPIPYNSFSNTISDIYNFNYKNFFLSKFYGSSEISKKIAHNAAINILKIIPPLNGYFSDMSKARNINKLSNNLGCAINLNSKNDNYEIEQAQNPQESNMRFERIIVSEEKEPFSFEEIIKSRENGNNLLDEAAFNNNVSQMKIFLPIVIQERGWQYIFELRNNKGINFLNIAFDNGNAAVLNEVIKICHVHNKEYSKPSDFVAEVTMASYTILQFVQQPKAKILESRFEEFGSLVPPISNDDGVEAYIMYHHVTQPIRGEYQFFSNEPPLLGNSSEHYTKD